MTLLVLAAVSFLLSTGVTFGLIRLAGRLSLLDQPNHRSSHSVPTPRGGGIGFAIVYLLLCVYLLFTAPDFARAGLALLIGGGAVALVGLIDDRLNVPSLVRFAVHAGASALAVFLLLPLPVVSGLGGLLAVVALVGAWLFVAWSINMYNFMDGIDGLGGGKAAVTLLAAGVAFTLTGSASLATFSLVLAAAVAGFLVWNWPPAKVFMGDVGSGLLGFMFGTLALASVHVEGMPVTLLPTLLAPFYIDATLTLIARIKSGEKWWEAHRSHNYQLAVRNGFSHRRVSIGILAVSGVLATMLVGTIPMPNLNIALTLCFLVVLTLVWLRIRTALTT